MTDDLERLEEKIEHLSERLRRLERAVFPETTDAAPATPPPAVDATASGATGAPSLAEWDAAAPSPDRATQPSAPTPSHEGFPVAAFISLVGRTLIVLGGAFLLRWLTQSGHLPQRVGSIIGMLYAILWVFMADFTARRGNRHSAAFHGVTAAMIALPLLVEVTVKFHFLTPTLSAIHLAAFILLGLVVAGRQDLRILAWIVTLPAAPVAFVLSTQTQAATPFLVSLLILGFVTLWLGYLRDWHLLAALMAAAANVGLALRVLDYVMMSRRTPPEHQISLWGILFLLFGLAVLYFGSYCFRVFNRKRTITRFEIGQTLAVVVVGLGGAALVIHAGGHTMLPLGIVCLVLSIACYVAAYGFLPRRDPNRRNFVFYTLLGLVLALLGVEILLPQPGSAVVFTTIALIAGMLAKRVSSPILFLHGAVYLLAAIVRSTLLAATFHGFVGPSTPLAHWITVPLLYALALTIAYPLFPRPTGRAVDLYLGRRSTDLLLFVTVLAVGGLFISVIAQASPLDAGTDAYRRLLASTRTGVLAVSAGVLAWCSHRPRFPNLAWLAYTLLALGAIKLMLQDIPAGGAAALFISFALYGGALIVVPRLLHRAREATD